jgi:hypothetical protein
MYGLVGELVEGGQFDSGLIEVDAFVSGIAFLFLVLRAVVDEDAAYF